MARNQSHAWKTILTVCSTPEVLRIVRLCHPCGRPCRRLVTVHLYPVYPYGITFSKSLELHEQMLLILFRSTGVDAHNLQSG